MVLKTRPGPEQVWMNRYFGKTSTRAGQLCFQTPPFKLSIVLTSSLYRTSRLELCVLFEVAFKVLCDLSLSFPFTVILWEITCIKPLAQEPFSKRWLLFANPVLLRGFCEGYSRSQPLFSCLLNPGLFKPHISFHCIPVNSGISLSLFKEGRSLPIRKKGTEGFKQRYLKLLCWIDTSIQLFTIVKFVHLRGSRI